MVKEKAGPPVRFRQVVSYWWQVRAMAWHGTWGHPYIASGAILIPPGVTFVTLPLYAMFVEDKEAKAEIGPTLLALAVGVGLWFVLLLFGLMRSSPSLDHEQKQEIERLRGPIESRLKRWKRILDTDVSRQFGYLTSAQQAYNIQANMGQIIIDEIDCGLFETWGDEDKLKTRVNQAKQKNLPKQQPGERWSELSITQVVFLVYMSVKDQDKSATWACPPEVPQRLQRTYGGIQQFVEDFECAIRVGEQRLGDKCCGYRDLDSLKK